jgi:hypothetical protein
MPVTDDYRAMSGKSKMGSSRADGKPTAPRSIFFHCHLPLEAKIGTQLRIAFQRVEKAFMQRLAPGLSGSAPTLRTLKCIRADSDSRYS